MRSATGWLFLTPFRYRKLIQIKTPQAERKPQVSWDSICITYGERIHFILIKRITIISSRHLSTAQISCALRPEFKIKPSLPDQTLTIPMPCQPYPQVHGEDQNALHSCNYKHAPLPPIQSTDRVPTKKIASKRWIPRKNGSCRNLKKAREVSNYKEKKEVKTSDEREIRRAESETDPQSATKTRE